MREDLEAGAAAGLSINARTKLAGSRGLSSELQEELLRDEALRVPRALAHNPSAAPGVLAELARSSDAATRKLVATNRTTPPAALKELAGDELEEVRAALAENTTSGEAQALLSRDLSSSVRWHLRRNRRLAHAELPVEFLETFEKGRAAVARALEYAEVDPETAKALRRSWVGTLEELVETARDFSGSACALAGP
jgi:hypothetical protein